MAKGGDRDYGPLTDLVLGGRDPEDSYGFVNPPVVRGSTVLWQTTADYKAAKGRYTYGRRGSPTKGIAFLFSEITRSPNTLDAHRAIRWSAEEGPAAQGALIERLFEAYFTEGEDISDPDVIGRCAEEAGLDWETLRDRLDSDEDVAVLHEEIERARAIGVEGVPCFILDGKLVVMGAHPGEVLAEAIDRALGDEDEAVES